MTEKQKWEKALAKHGLANRQFDTEGIIAHPVPKGESSGIQNHQFDPGLSDDWTAQASLQIGDEEVPRYHLVPLKIHHRFVPAWTLSDTGVRFFLLDAYPRLARSDSQRKLAAFTCAVIYRYFRMCEPAPAIARDMGIDLKAIETRIQRIRERAANLGLD